MSDELRIVRAGSLRSACRISGPDTGPPLLLLHALGEDSRDWAGVAPALARTHRVHALDLRGHGRTEWPGTYSVEAMRDDVLGHLDALGLDRVDVVGHSMGGVVAALLAMHRPARVRRLVLEDVPLLRPREPKPATRPDGELSFDWAVVAAVRAQLDHPDPAWAQGLRNITAPTLAVAGGPASHVPQEDIAELVRRVPDARLVTIPAGHLVHHARPQEFLAAVLPFLGGDTDRRDGRDLDLD
ncbi:alpha/beta fold hydrolase [Streptomyces xanthii]|uniref:Alpha/beta fold hydrolase n=1 Tax=Streptomyces xanthii TaxID=2768069 RepID=A0A7H1B108_9ACTN|nr:alpha/beta fold hydrolase [Streptomyces xanthii]QNS02413.1 alpha/beta fold hydrolase [Streptomyces xanthii]